MELLWNVCVMTSAHFFPTPWHIVSVFYLSQVFLKPSCCCLLGGSHMLRTGCFFYELFLNWKHLDAEALWIPHCLTERRAQLRQRAHVHLLSVRGWGHILSIYPQNGCIFRWCNEGRGENCDWTVQRQHMMSDARLFLMNASWLHYSVADWTVEWKTRVGKLNKFNFSKNGNILFILSIQSLYVAAFAPDWRWFSSALMH